MSAANQQRKEDPDPAPKPGAQADKDKATPAPEVNKPGLKYVFKISPADPRRNSIDFEDVADK